MNIRNVMVACLCGFLFWGSGSAQEAGSARQWEIGAHPGISLPGGNNNDLEEASFNVQATIERHTRSPWSFGLEAGRAVGHPIEGNWFIDYDEDGIEEVLEVKGNRDKTVLQVTPFIRRSRVDDWGTWGIRHVRRYYVLGMGYYQTAIRNGHYAVDGLTSTGLNLDGVVAPFGPEIDNDFGINFGAGLEAQIFTFFRLGFDLRYHRIFRNPKDFEYWIPSCRFGYTF